MNFKESLDYLFGLGYERSVKKFGLENTYALLSALGNPQKNFIKVQVAGTNGKGSTCAFLESVLVEAGIKVGVNTSPHLVSVTERIRINGAEISEEKFAEYATRVRKTAERLVETGALEATPTFFEHVTSIAQLVFADEQIEVAILETGLGGRFDATTATEAEIVAITPIALDHTKTLGDTIEKIAAEKAAIIREGVQAVIAEQKEAAIRVILAKCEAEKVSPLFAEEVRCLRKTRMVRKKSTNRDTIAVENVGRNREGDICTGSGGDPVGGETSGNTTARECAKDGKALTSFYVHKASYENVCLNLPGKHQIENATVAILLAEALAEKGFRIGAKEIKSGLEKAVHKGRLEFSDGILYDGAHNLAGAKALRQYLNEEVDQPITMIFGSMRGKNLEKVAGVLFPLSENLILTTPENPRAMEASDIVEFALKNVDENSCFVIDAPSKALEKARQIVGDNGLILVTGSLYLIGEIKANLRGRRVERRKKKIK